MIKIFFDVKGSPLTQMALQFQGVEKMLMEGKMCQNQKKIQ
jgi:hypothetical protein